MSSILPKNELWNVNFCPSLLEQKFFVCFLKELKKTKSPFEINWPRWCISRMIPINKLYLNFQKLSNVHISRNRIIWFNFHTKKSKWVPRVLSDLEKTCKHFHVSAKLFRLQYNYRNLTLVSRTDIQNLVLDTETWFRSHTTLEAASYVILLECLFIKAAFCFHSESKQR